MMMMDNTKELMMEYTLSEQRRGQLERMLGKTLRVLRYMRDNRRRLMEHAEREGNEAEAREWLKSLVETISFEDILENVLAGNEASIDRLLRIYEE